MAKIYDLDIAVTDVENILYKSDIDIDLKMTFNKNSISFGHFGCWGLDGCAESGDFRKLINNQLADNLDFNIVTGDNVYMQNSYDPAILNGGINCLNNLTFPSFVALGNHDVLQCKIMYDQIDKTEMRLSNGKLLIDTEKSKWVMPHNYYTLQVNLTPINKTVQFIFIDTNLFNDYAEDCYTHLQHQRSISRKAKLQEMLLWIENIIATSTANMFIFVGHVYLFGYVRPEDMYGNFSTKHPDKIVKLMHVEKLLHIMKKIKSDKIYYLCSDIHHYQYIKFNGKNIFEGLNIDIITAGTGGGIPDPIPKSPIGRTDTIKIGNEIIGQIELVDVDKPYGYMRHTFDGNKLITSYVQNN